MEGAYQAALPAKKITVRVPATSANCGPGFDCMGLALTYYNITTYEVTDEPGFKLQVRGEGADTLKPHGRNLAFASFLRLWNKYTGGERIGLKAEMVNNIPLSRGLGSSSSAIVAGLYAANKILGSPYDKETLLAMATEIEGHPDNVAPALYGGFVVGYKDAEGEVHSLKLKIAAPLKFIAAVPERKLSTALARQALPKTVPHADAVFNSSHAALLTAALLSGRGELLGEALKDKLHQPYRAHLIPGLQKVFDAAQKAGAYQAIISGAGSTVLAYAPAAADGAAIGEAMCAAFRAEGEACRYHVLSLDEEGAKAIEP